MTDYGGRNPGKLASFTRDNTIMNAGRLVTAHFTRYHFYLC